MERAAKRARLPRSPKVVQLRYLLDVDQYGQDCVILYAILADAASELDSWWDGTRKIATALREACWDVGLTDYVYVRFRLAAEQKELDRTPWFEKPARIPAAARRKAATRVPKSSEERSRSKRAVRDAG